MLPLDAQEEVTGVEVWHHDSKTWKTVIGEGLTDDADDASHHSDRSWDYRWNEDYHFAKKTVMVIFQSGTENPNIVPPTSGA